MRPLVSVIMNCLNGARYLREAINSVFSQSFSDWEIIFWDNASTDESGSIAKSYGDKVRYYNGKTTVSLGAARNKAFSKCRGKYIAILDVDDLWLPNKLEHQLSLFENNPELGMTFSNTIFFDEYGDKQDMFQSATPKRGSVFGDLLAQSFMSTETMIYKRKALDELEYVFDDDFTMVMDYDLSLRVAYFYEIDYVESPLSKWRMHTGSESSRKRFLIWRENQILLEKLCKNLPDIKNKYENQINRSLKYIKGQLALEQWSKGNRSAARNYLLPFLNDPKYLAAYLSTWFCPFAIFDKAQVSASKLIRSVRR